MENKLAWIEVIGGFHFQGISLNVKYCKWVSQKGREPNIEIKVWDKEEIKGSAKDFIISEFLKTKMWEEFINSTFRIETNK